jgi:hypothetical protein
MNTSYAYCIVICPFIADGVEDPSSPVRCFIPISAQHDSAVDYHHQLHVAAAVRQLHKIQSGKEERNGSRKNK